VNHYCTYFDRNYLDRGLALHESMARYCRPFHLWVLALCGRTETALAKLALEDVTVVSLGEFATDELRAAQPNRERHEWIWTLTPFWMQWVLERVEAVSYIDADCYFFNAPGDAYREFQDADVAITPHRYSPDRIWMARSSGLYNVGLVHARRAGLACLQEWGRLCLARCVQDEGADQKYWDELLPRYGGHAIAHKGVGLAPWNQAGQYRYSSCGGQAHVDGEPLVMYHFHKRLEPGFTLDPFVKEHVYPPYAGALARAEEKIRGL
jgi:hypothetical protein